MKEREMTPEGRATVPPELIAYLAKEYSDLQLEHAQGVWGYVWDRLAQEKNWDEQLEKLGLKK